MATEKPAGLHLSKKLNELEVTGVRRRRRRPRLLDILKATLWFVGGFGRVLKLIDAALTWWDTLF